MENCLVTKLKGSVSGDGLIKLNIIEFKLQSSSSETKVISRLGGYDSTHPIIAEMTSGIISNNGDIAHGEAVKSFYGDSARNYQTTAESYLRIKDKYNLGYLNFVKYSESAGYILTLGTTRAQDDVFNLEQISYCSNLATFVIDDSFGDISAFGKCINLQIFSIRSGRLTGSIDALIKQWIANGRSSQGSITAFMLGRYNSDMYQASESNVYFGNKLVNLHMNSTLAWESANKMYIIAPEYHQVWYIGYSADEVAAKTASGGAWEGNTPINCK